MGNQKDQGRASTMREEPLRCRGMRDLLPAEMARFREVERVFREACLAWGYQEVRTPTVEHLYLFTGAGTLSPQMLGRVYSFLDWDGWSGERVVLRPDATIPVARLFVERLRDQKLAKLFYVQNVFRFSEGDESREDWQCGVELIGDTQPLGDVELILLGREVLERLGLSPTAVRLSHPGIVRAVLAKAGVDPTEQLRLYDRILDGDLSAFSEVERRIPEVGASLEVLLGMEGEGAGYLANTRSAFVKAIPELARPLEELTVIVEALSALGCYCLISAALVRNFEYYTGPVFQFVAGGEKVGGGGRYDSLISLVGGEPLPASGFALYATRLADMVATPETNSKEARVIVQPTRREAALVAASFQAAGLLRERGWPAEVAVADGLSEGRWRLLLDGEAYTLTHLGSQRSQRFQGLEAVAKALVQGDLEAETT